MKNIFFFFAFSILFSCSLSKKLNIEYDTIEKIEVLQGFPGEKINMKDGFERELIKELNNAKENGPWKFMKTYQVLIYYKEGIIDTLRTNGQIFVNDNGYFETKENVILKFTNPQTTPLTP